LEVPYGITEEAWSDAVKSTSSRSGLKTSKENVATDTSETLSWNSKSSTAKSMTEPENFPVVVALLALVK
jgi:hypothetical protein